MKSKPLLSDDSVRILNALLKNKLYPSYKDAITQAMNDLYQKHVKEETERSAKINPGYHLTHIEKGVLGELSKIQEELDEAKDAEKQGVKIMLAVELSDLIGAVEAYAKKSIGLSLEDLVKMKEVTARAFLNGRRK